VVEFDLLHLEPAAPLGLVPQTILERAARVLLSDEELYRFRVVKLRERIPRAFALAEIGRSEAIDVYLRREDAWAALEEILNDEPEWAVALFVTPIELDERELSLN
jgi:hypothetical protein